MLPLNKILRPSFRNSRTGTDSRLTSRKLYKAIRFAKLRKRNTKTVRPTSPTSLMTIHHH